MNATILRFTARPTLMEARMTEAIRAELRLAGVRVSELAATGGMPFGSFMATPGHYVGGGALRLWADDQGVHYACLDRDGLVADRVSFGGDVWAACTAFRRALGASA